MILEGLWAHRRIGRSEERGLLRGETETAGTAGKPRHAGRGASSIERVAVVAISSNRVVEWPRELAMKVIRYGKYVGEPADAVDLEELVKRMGDFFLQSGFESQYYGVSEMDNERSMEALKRSDFARAAGRRFAPGRRHERGIAQNAAESPSPKQPGGERFTGKIDGATRRRRFHQSAAAAAGDAAAPKHPAGVWASRRSGRSEARFEITDKTIDFLGFKTLQDLMGSMGRSSFGRHDTRDLSTGVESGGVSRPYEFGDTLNMDVSETLFNAVRREGVKVPIEMTIRT